MSLVPIRQIALASLVLGCATAPPTRHTPASTFPALQQAAESLRAPLVALRRDLHRHPELSGSEERTAGVVAERLRALGLEVRTGVGGHGVVGVLRGGRPGPVVAWRADMDAVAGEEPPDREYRSLVPGVQHVCGHDLHIAIGLGTAEVLARHRAELPGTVVFLFQPAEETLQGAAAMIADGALAAPRPQAIFALHSFPLPVGTVAHGAAFAGLDEVTVELSGSAATEKTAHAVEAALLGLGTVRMPESLEDFHRLIEELQAPAGPLAEFVFVAASSRVEPGSAAVNAAFKASSDAAYPRLRERVRALVGAIAADGSYELRFRDSWFPGMFSDPGESAAAADTLRQLLGSDRVAQMHTAVPIAGEDFALFLREVPGAMLFLGVANPARGIVGIPHLPSFDADEEALVVGTAAASAVLWARLQRTT